MRVIEIVKISGVYVLKLLLIISVIMSAGCAWIGRDYYFDNDSKMDGWNKEFLEGKGSDKGGVHPDTATFHYNEVPFSFGFRIVYQDATVFGPLMIPIIPLPWSHSEDLTVNVTIETSKEIALDISSWEITDLETKTTFQPNSVFLYTNKTYHQYPDDVPSRININGATTVRVEYSVKASDINIVEVNFGKTLNRNGLATSTIRLEKVKGNWHYNQFTL